MGCPHSGQGTGASRRAARRRRYQSQYSASATGNASVLDAASASSTGGPLTPEPLLASETLLKALADHPYLPATAAANPKTPAAALRQLFAAGPFLIEYLLGLDHAVLADARRADDTGLNGGDKTLFAGFADYLAQLAAADQQQGTARAAEFRSDEQVAAAAP